MEDQTQKHGLSIRSVALILQDAASIEAIEFYVATDAPSKQKALGCRLHGYSSLSKEQIHDLCSKLNFAINGVCNKEARLLKERSANALRRYL